MGTNLKEKEQELRDERDWVSGAEIPEITEFTAPNP
jgi:hypothetical protein